MVAHLTVFWQWGAWLTDCCGPRVLKTEGNGPVSLFSLDCGVACVTIYFSSSSYFVGILKSCFFSMIFFVYLEGVGP